MEKEQAQSSEVEETCLICPQLRQELGKMERKLDIANGFITAMQRDLSEKRQEAIKGSLNGRGYPHLPIRDVWEMPGESFSLLAA